MYSCLGPAAGTLDVLFDNKENSLCVDPSICLADADWSHTRALNEIIVIQSNQATSQRKACKRRARSGVLDGIALIVEQKRLARDTHLTSSTHAHAFACARLQCCSLPSARAIRAAWPVMACARARARGHTLAYYHIIVI